MFTILSYGNSFVSRCNSFPRKLARLKSENYNDDLSNNEINKIRANSVFADKIIYVDPTFLGTESDPTPSTREIPLFLLSSPFFPQGTTYLNIFEMKYRNMMFDISQKDDSLGWISIDERSGQLALVGTLCKVVERELMEDGKQFITIEGIQRFKVRKILKTLPYFIGEVDLIEDDVPENTAETFKIEKECYSILKYYIRLIRLTDPRKMFVLTSQAKKYRPSLKDNNINDITRLSKFSLSLGNIIQMFPNQAQQLLQTTSITKRLFSLRMVLSEIANVTAVDLVKGEFLTEAEREEIKTRSFGEDDTDDDILPEDIYDAKEADKKDEWDLSAME